MTAVKSNYQFNQVKQPISPMKAKKQLKKTYLLDQYKTKNEERKLAVHTAYKQST